MTILDNFYSFLGLTRPPPRRKQKRVRQAHGIKNRRKRLTPLQRDVRIAIRRLKALDRGESRLLTGEEVRRALGI